MDGDTPIYYFADAERPNPMRLAEERELYVPKLSSDPDYRPRPEAYAAAEAHCSRLRRAERQVEEATLLAEVLRAAMRDAVDARAMQVDAVIRIVEKKLRKARADIDRQETRDLNLFLAYAELEATVQDG